MADLIRIRTFIDFHLKLGSFVPRRNTMIFYDSKISRNIIICWRKPE